MSLLFDVLLDLPKEVVIGGLLILGTVIFQYMVKRMTGAKKKAVLDSSAHPSGPRNKSYDYVVLGAGPGGCAAASRLVDLHRKENDGAECSVLLLDQGVAAEGSNLVLPSMVPNWSKSAIDCGEFAVGPFANDGPKRNEVSDEAEIDIAAGIPAAKKWLTRGSGAGGCTLLDHGIHFCPSSSVQKEASLSEADKKDLTEFFVDPYGGAEVADGEKDRPVVKDNAPVEVRFNSFRSPLAWAFAESANVGCDYDKRLTTETEAYPGGVADGKEGDKKYEAGSPSPGRFVFPFWLRSNRGSKKENFYFHDVSKKKQIDIVLGWTIVDTPTMDDTNTTVSSILVGMSKRHATGAKSKTVGIKMGLVLACGTYATPKLLQQWCKTIVSPSSGLTALTAMAAAPAPPVSYDTLSLPVVYQTLPGLSNDSCNISGALNQVKQAWGKPTPLLNALTDSAATVTLENGVTLMIQFVPSGGFGREFFKRLDRSECLGLFKEAMEFKVTAMIPVKVDLIAANSSTIEQKGDDEVEERKQLLMDSLVRGIELSREIVQCKPLNQLTTGKEVLDISLFPETLGSNKRPRRHIFKILYGKPMKKGAAQTRQYRREVADIINEARQFALGRAYLEGYVRAHAGYSGYSCGSLVPSAATSNEEGSILEELARMKIVVADASRIPAGTLTSIGGGGTVALATAMGWEAAKEIVGIRKSSKK